MKRDYVPAWRPDNEVSFYDRVEGVHYICWKNELFPRFR